MRGVGGFMSVCMCVLYWVNLKCVYSPVTVWIECLSVSGEVFDSSSADSSPAPSADGVSKENMVTPTPSRTRTTEDLFAAIHRYHDTFSLFTPLSTPSYTVTPASLLLTFFIPRYKMHSTAVVYFSLCTLSFHFLFVFLSTFPLSVSISFPLSHPLINHGASPWTPSSFSPFILQPIISLSPSSSYTQPLSHNFTQRCPICKRMHLSGRWFLESPSTGENGFFCFCSVRGLNLESKMSQ